MPLIKPELLLKKIVFRLNNISNFLTLNLIYSKQHSYYYLNKNIYLFFVKYTYFFKNLYMSCIVC